MPWEERSLMDVRLRFVQDVHRPGWSVAEVCRRYDVSRKTGYKWLERYGLAGPAGLADRSHRPYSCPHATPAPIVEQILALQRRYRWGARKVRWLLAQRVPAELVPTVATVHRILERHGRTGRRRRAHRRFHAGRPVTPFDQPNAIWTADFKGQFRTGNGVYCYPLTVQDGATRFLLGCRGLLAPTIEASEPVFARLFRRYGRPERIHKTLKAETARPPRRTLTAQQRRFDWFRQRYNAERPHEALGQQLPASVYHASARPYPTRLLPIAYPGHYEVRRVSRNGGIRWGSRWVNVSHVLAELDVGFEAIDEGLWEVYFGPVWLGRLHETTCRIVDHLGRAARRAGGNHKGEVLPIS